MEKLACLINLSSSLEFVKKSVPELYVEQLGKENVYVLSKIGLPRKILDFSFDNKLGVKEECLILGHWGEEPVICDMKLTAIYAGSSHFYLAKSVMNLLSQLLTIEYFWTKIVGENKFGSYRENLKLYASFLEKSLLEIDKDLLKNDNSYFWGAMIEDIEHGIVE